MKKLSTYLFLLLFSFHTPSWAYDISDFQIEGMSIGDSLLDYYSEEEIKKAQKNNYDYSNKFIDFWAPIKLKNKEFDAIVLSLAGLKMLNLENEVKEIFSTDQMLPAIGQGAIALQCRKDDHKTLNIVKMINDKESYCCIQAERALLEAIGGDCDTAVGGLAKLLNEKIVLKSELFSSDGNKKFVVENSGNFNEAKDIGHKVGEELLKKAGSDFKVQGN